MPLSSCPWVDMHKLTFRSLHVLENLIYISNIGEQCIYYNSLKIVFFMGEVTNKHNSCHEK